MTEKEFKKRLKEDRFFENPDELIDYRLPVVQHYLTKYTNSIILINGKLAFNEIKEKFNHESKK